MTYRHQAQEKWINFQNPRALPRIFLIIILHTCAKASQYCLPEKTTHCSSSHQESTTNQTRHALREILQCSPPLLRHGFGGDNYKVGVRFESGQTLQQYSRRCIKFIITRRSHVHHCRIRMFLRCFDRRAHHLCCWIVVH